MQSDLLKKHNFRFNKKYGQNFISDTNLLSAIAADAGIGEDSFVLEIGAGAGSLTKILAQRARQVVSFEIDEALRPVLAEALAGSKNAQIVFGDFLKFSDEQLAALFPRHAQIEVVANLPYYITTPILFRLLESALNIKSITVMLQKEVAERLTAKAGTKDYGVITAVIAYTSSTKITRNVNRTLFTPVPDVDSAVIKITPDPARPRAKSDETYYRLVRAAFAMRRKTLANNLLAAFPLTREEAEDKIKKAGLPPAVRGEQLTVQDFINLSDCL